jgi:hypothetical protein
MMCGWLSDERMSTCLPSGVVRDAGGLPNSMKRRTDLMNVIPQL